MAVESDLAAQAWTIDGVFMGAVAERWAGKPPSAIGKQPFEGAAEASPTGLIGDAQADLSVHGGLEKAIHHYPAEHYALWRGELGREDLKPGGFGENISTVGLDEEAVSIGDVFRLGSALVQVSQGRQPCWKLAAHTEEPRMAYLFQTTGRTGWYYRVLEPGRLAAGEAMTLVERPTPEWTVRRVTAARLRRDADAPTLRALAALETLNEGWRAAFAKMAAGDRDEATDRRLKGL
ncbi:MAG: MOSC domain-containing protein [Pseudomonadota bacterium]